MPIFILEDQILQSRALSNILYNIFERNNIYNELIHIYSRPKDLLEAARQSNELKMFFLDIQINRELLSGLEVAKEIRKNDNESLIVFVSTHSELVLTSYKYMVSALQFVEKNSDLDVFKQEIEDCLLKYIHKKTTEESFEDYVLINLKSSSMKCNIDDIYYFQTEYDHRISLVGKGIRKEFYGTLAKIEKLHDNLVRIHQSSVANKKYIMKLDSKSRQITMKDGTELPVSRRYYSFIKDLFTV